MQLSISILAVTAIAVSLLAPSSALGASATLSFDRAYDDGATSLANVACSDGPNGLLTKGYTTFGSLPHFPNIGGAQAVGGWDSAACGSCWQLTYTTGTKTPTNRSITVLAVDHADSGFNIALGAMNALTDNQAEHLGRVNVTATQVDASACGL